MTRPADEPPRPRTNTRLNARLDPGLQRQLDYIKRRTGQNTSTVVKKSIELYYQSLRSAASARETLRETGFVGCAEGPSDLSARYKQEYARLLAGKSR